VRALERVKRGLKRVASSVAPQTTIAIQSARARAHSHRMVREWGLADLNRKLVDRFGSTVRSGPFCGMTLSPMSHQEALGPYLLGTYEAQLHPWVETVAAGPFAQVLDIGAKFGYYAVGLARRLPQAQVVAFDPDWWARSATAEMATANRTPNVTPAGFCSPKWLDQHLRPGGFILSDCEGYEGVLFGTARTPALDTATLLVEIHDNLVPGVGAAVRDRFARTHSVAAGSDAPRPAPPVDLGFLTPAEVEAATLEVRGLQEWLLFSPLAR
jgi:hypothetical protein